MSNVTFFTIPKLFRGIFDTAQRNAITSWTRLKPTPEIILCGNDEGVAKFAKEKGLLHIPDIETSENSTPYLSDTFLKVHEISSNPILVYSNCDIIFLNDFMPAIDRVNRKFSRDFLMIGQRFDADVTQQIDFTNSRWETDLRKQVHSGKYHSVLGIDYFVFRKGSWESFPPFIVGRPGWDNWFVSEALRKRHAVVDATDKVLAIHQNHDFSHLAGGHKEARHGLEARYNIEKASGSKIEIRSIADTTYKIGEC